jgi:hypothetical protein
MLRPLLMALFICVMSTTALAQTPARFEIMGGYSRVNLDPRSSTDSAVGEIGFPSGWQAGFTYYVRDGIGLAVEMRGHSTTEDLGSTLGEVDATLRTFMAGARLIERKGHFGGGLRLLAGKVWTTTESPTAGRDEDSGFTASFGGEFDVMFGRFGIRIVQADVLWTVIGKENPSFALGAGVFYQW